MHADIQAAVSICAGDSVVQTGKRFSPAGRISASQYSHVWAARSRSEDLLVIFNHLYFASAVAFVPASIIPL